MDSTTTTGWFEGFSEAVRAKAEALCGRDGVFDARRAGRALRACCEGGDRPAYPVEVTLSDDGARVVRARCGCAAGATGRCKHAAAVLMTWAARPWAFHDASGVGASLRRRSTESLASLVEEMVALAPWLERVAMPVAHSGERARSAMRRHGTAWGAAGAITWELSVLKARGEALLRAGDLRGATEVFRGLGEGVLEGYAAVAGQDGDGALRALAVDAARGLTTALARANDRDLRREALTALWSVAQGDLACSDVGAAEEIPEAILRYADEAERAMVAGWIFERAAREGFAANDPLAWSSMPFGALLFELLRDGLDLDEVLRGLKTLGRHVELVDAMLLHGRRDEAVAAAWECPTEALPAVAGLLARWGVGADLDAAVRARLERDPSEALFTWWGMRCRARGDLAAARVTAEEMLGMYPSVARWESLREETPEAERAALQSRVVAALAARGGRRPEAVRVLLAMGELDAAEECTRGEPTVASAGHPVVSGARLSVAEAAAEKNPSVAMTIWSAHVEALVATGDRARYREAAGFIRRMQGLGVEESKAWVAWARETHPRRRALRVELTA
ncbi:MAG: hypothetical protein IPF99_15405 [Deltaproteobacteria bacterium]|nr:hypothetical protein [Deltaproteobacteria bacterium]